MTLPMTPIVEAIADDPNNKVNDRVNDPNRISEESNRTAQHSAT